MVLANRLKQVVPCIISPFQRAFVGNKYSLDVLMANERIDSRKLIRKEGLVFKINLEKAHSHVEWDFDLVIVISGGSGCGNVYPLLLSLFWLTAFCLVFSELLEGFGKGTHFPPSFSLLWQSRWVLFW